MFVALLCTSTACATAPVSRWEIPIRLGVPYVVDGPQCAEARTRARTVPQPADLIAAGARDFVVLAEPPRGTVRMGTGFSITVPVDSAGKPIKGQMRVAPIDTLPLPRLYVARLQDRVERIEFVPAVLSGCGVAGEVTMTFVYR